MKKVLSFILVAFILLLFAATFAWDGVRTYFMKKFMSHRPAPVVTIASAVAQEQSWHDTLKAIGTLKAVKGVQVTPRTNGQVSRVLFKSGQQVKAGQSLVQLDDRAAKQTLESDQATLANAQLKYNQNKKLAQTGAVSETVLNSSLTALRTAKAGVAAAQLNVQFLDIVAPFSGKLGIRQVDLGQYVQVNTPIVSLQQLSPIYVDFSLPTQDLTQLKVGQTVRVRVDAYPKASFKGQIEAISPMINASTRTLSIRAELNNKNERLLPGGFANVDVLLPLQQKVVTVPLTAISYSLFGNNLYVLEKTKENKKEKKKEKKKTVWVARQRIVQLGKRVGNRVIVLNGLKKGEQVVSAGQLKLHNGSLVNVNNKVKL